MKGWPLKPPADEPRLSPRIRPRAFQQPVDRQRFRRRPVGQAAFRPKPDADLDGLLQALRGDPGQLIEQGRLDLLVSPNLQARD